jgi:hypothetical protein
MAEADTGWRPNISDHAVSEATGRDWNRWKSELDAWAPGMAHKDIAARLREDYALSGWWAQMVSGSWEMMTGRRDPNQRAKAEGGKFQASASKTITTTAERIEESFAATDFANWGPEGLFERSSGTLGRSLNGAWSEGGRVSLWLTAKPDGKFQISLSHDGIDTAAECDRMKAEWRAALTRLKERLEE